MKHLCLLVMVDMFCGGSGGWWCSDWYDGDGW